MKTVTKKNLGLQRACSKNGLAIFSVNIHGNLRQQLSRLTYLVSVEILLGHSVVIHANIRQVSLVSRFVTVTE